MITVLKNGATAEQRDKLIKWFEQQGLKVNVSVGEFQTVLGLVGDTTQIDDELVGSLEIVETIKRISEPYKRVNRKFHPDDSVIDVNGVKIGGGNFAIIAGPCSVESKEQIIEVFDMAGESVYNISLFENSSHIGAMGCAKLITESDKNFAVLDMGQTNIKRCLLTKRSGELSNINVLETMPSINMELDFSDSVENYSRAFELHRYLVNILADTCKDIELKRGETGEVIVSIANYVVGGTLNTFRGGYAKLSLLGHDYASLLSDELSSRLHRPMRVRLLHDGTAIALNFAGQKDTVCLSLGTAFGVGFPPERVDLVVKI